ncbi:MAG: alpha/beta fold hydrolase [Gordonia sp. (in: high G+C Gram-positive bacteria)]|uniref:alpha/beta fold hydrolase n=1 Tax=Gordonia sp. (in: high G+C Gram-positive bacteria) TaxID=84139 RepID=UPI003C73D593
MSSPAKNNGSPVSEAVLERDGLILRAGVYGDSAAPVALLVHGFPDTPHSWDAVVPRLVAGGYRVVVPWLRGYTAESVNPNARYDIPTVASDLIAWQEWAGGEPVHLIGHDWGSVAATIAVKKSPERWRSVSLLAVPPMGGRAMSAAILRAVPRQLVMSSYMLVMQSGLSPRLLARNDAAFVRWLWRRWSPTWDFTDADFAPTREVFVDKERGWATTRYYRSIFTPNRAYTREFMRLAQADYPVQVPTLSLAGENDGCMSAAFHTAMNQLHPQIDAVLLPGCGHFLHAEKPAVVADEMLKHLGRHS